MASVISPYQNKQIFQNTMNFLGRKIALEDRAKEAEKRKTELNRIRQAEWDRQDWRDKVKRVQSIIDTKNKQLREDAIWEKTVKYNDKVRKDEAAAKEQIHQQHRQEKLDDIVKEVAIRNGGTKKTKDENTLKVLKLGAKMFDVEEPNGYVTVDDKSKPILADDINKMKSISDKHSRDMAVASGNYNKAFNKLPKDLQKKLLQVETTPINIEELNTVVKDYYKKYKNTSFKSRGKFTKEKSNISAFKDAFTAQRSAITRIETDLKENSKKTVGYEQKKQFSPEEKVKNINNVILKYLKQIDATNDKDKARILWAKVNKLKSDSLNLIKDEIIIEKLKQKNTMLENKFRIKAQNSIDPTELKIEYIGNKDLKEIFPSFESYLEHKVNKLTGELWEKDQLKKIK